MKNIYHKYSSTIAITGMSVVLALALYVSFPELQSPVQLASGSEYSELRAS